MPYRLRHTSISKILGLSVQPIPTKHSDCVSIFDPSISSEAVLHQLVTLLSDYSTEENSQGARVLEQTSPTQVWRQGTPPIPKLNPFGKLRSLLETRLRSHLDAIQHLQPALFRVRTRFRLIASRTGYQFCEPSLLHGASRQCATVIRTDTTFQQGHKGFTSHRVLV
jgi:hypothetical protein